MRLNARVLQKAWQVSVAHGLYHHEGIWYHHLKRFPGALFDSSGYVRFETKQAYLDHPKLAHTHDLYIADGLHSLPEYVRMPPVSANGSETGANVDSKLVRVAYNSAEWERPTGDAKKYETRGTFNYVNGFGYEDWLFRTDWQLDGWHYGFLQAFNKTGKKYHDQALDVTLFTIEPDKRRRCVADIVGLEILSEADAAAALEIYQQCGWFELMRKEVIAVGGNVSVLSSSLWAPNVLNVRFRLENLRHTPPDSFFENDDWIARRWRYRPFSFGPTDQQHARGKLRGRRGDDCAPTPRKNLRRGCAPVLIDPKHQEMVAKLEQELRKEFPGCRIKMEENWIDLSLQTPAGLILFELKSDLNARTVIREALGQILEYAYFLRHDLPIRGLVIVGRVAMREDEARYLAHLQQTFSLPISYRKISV